MIETDGLSKRFGQKLAVDGLTLTVRGGEVMGFLGPNGSGKTTSILLLMGLLRPTSGSARILGRDCHADAVALKKVVGYLPDEPFLYPYLSLTNSSRAPQAHHLAPRSGERSARQRRVRGAAAR